jgi:uncharacterized protein (DUF302 family)
MAMQDSVSAAADLPLRVAVWKDDRNQTWIGYDDLDALSKRDCVADPAIIDNMKDAMERIVQKSANID